MWAKSAMLNSIGEMPRQLACIPQFALRSTGKMAGIYRREQL
jgi:hypothetical protein